MLGLRLSLWFHPSQNDSAPFEKPVTSRGGEFSMKNNNDKITEVMEAISLWWSTFGGAVGNKASWLDLRSWRYTSSPSQSDLFLPADPHQQERTQAQAAEQLGNLSSVSFPSPTSPPVSPYCHQAPVHLLAAHTDLDDQRERSTDPDSALPGQPSDWSRMCMN